MWWLVSGGILRVINVYFCAYRISVSLCQAEEAVGGGDFLYRDLLVNRPVRNWLNAFSPNYDTVVLETESLDAWSKGSR